MTLFRLALRSHVAGFVATTAIAALFGLGNTIGYAQVAGSDPQERAIFAQQMAIVGRQLSYMLPIPVELETLSGYLQWRHFGNLPLVYAFWALIAATGAGRGDEERGIVEHWLAAGVPRARYLLARAVGFAAVAVVSVLLMLGSVLVGSVVTGETVAPGALARQGLALWALVLCCWAISLVAAQLVTTRRGAAGIAGVVLLSMFLVNAASRTGGLEQLRVLSPFSAYERSAPLVSTGDLDATATAGLLAAAALMVAVAAAAFGARDLGASLLRFAPPSGRRVGGPSRDPFLRLPVLAIVDQQRVWIAGWAIGIAALATFLISLTRTMVDALLEIPSMRFYFERLGTAGYDTFVAVIWGSTALLLLSLFAIFQVSAWVADDVEGRLETVLAQPVSRGRVVLERLGSLVLGSGLVVLAGSVAVWWASAREGITLDQDRFVLASALMVTVPFAFGAIGAAAAATRPRLAVPALAAVAILSYFTQQFAPLFDWPEWFERTSIFALYGTPLSTGVDWGGITLLIAFGAVGTVLGATTMRRRDVGR